MTRHVTLEERLGWQVERRGAEACWPWTGPTNRAGFGQIDRGDYSADVVGAHVVAWELANGRHAPKGLVIRQTCRDTLCCNPDHLSLGVGA
jgi:hypothetical protein